MSFVSSILTLEGFFLLATIVGGVVFAIQLVMLFTGVAGDVDFDADVDMGGGDVGHAGADVSFKVLSLQGLSAFFLMFGLVGLALHNQSKAGNGISLAGAFVAGWVSTWVIARIFRTFSRLQSSGTLDMSQAAGVSGIVYLNIEPNKPGKVTITVRGRLLTLDAISDHQITTGSPIKVLRVINDNMVAVEPQ